MNQKIELLLDECKLIQENCRYNLSIHFDLAERKLQQSRWFTLLPAVTAAIAGASTALGAPLWIGWVGAIAGVAGTIANLLDPSREFQAHTISGKNFTVLRNDARSLHEVHWKFMSEKELRASVEKLEDRYNHLLEDAPLMSNIPFTKFNQAYDAATKVLQTQNDEPDFKQSKKTVDVAKS